MKNIAAVWLLFLVLTLTLLTGCGASGPNTPVINPAPLSADNLNLIFTVSPDLAFQAPGDVNPSTANLTNQGLQRTLLMATFLHQQVLGNKNVSEISVLEPMTHLQTTSNYPDMVALANIQQFAFLNQVTLSSDPQSWVPLTVYSYPVNVSYAAGPVPSGVAAPLLPCPGCHGLDFNDLGSDNENLLTGMITANVPGFYLFSAPWETTSGLLAKINQLEGYNLTLPESYKPNYVYAISISPMGRASLVTYNSNLNPLSTYPALPAAVPSSACTAQAPFSIAVTGGIGGAVIPAGANTNETVYMIRHAEAHPQGWWDDGNFVGAGQWRALALPNALAGKISPNQVWSIDPAQVIPGTETISGDSYWSYVRTSLTVEPYAVANNLPLNLAAGLEILAPNAPKLTSEFFFNGGRFSNQKVLIGWEHESISFMVDALLASYFPSGGAPTAPSWPDADYDTVWTVTSDAAGNLTVDNATCEGINSAVLPDAPPQF